MNSGEKNASNEMTVNQEPAGAVPLLEFSGQRTMPSGAKNIQCERSTLSHLVGAQIC